MRKTKPLIIPSGKTVTNYSVQRSRPIWTEFSRKSRRLQKDDFASRATTIAARIAKITVPIRNPTPRRITANTQKTTAVAVDPGNNHVYIAQQGQKWTRISDKLDRYLTKLEDRYGTVVLCQANSRVPNMHAEMIIVACKRGNVKNLLFGSAELPPCPACACTLVEDFNAVIAEVGELPNLTWVHPTEFYALQKP